MSQDCQGRVFCRGGIFHKLVFWLIAGLLLIFVHACGMSPVDTPTMTGIVSDEQAILPSITNTWTPTIQQATQTSTAITETFTPRATIPEPTDTATLQPSATSVPPVVFAVIGDYGSGNQDEGDVAELIMSWQPDLIITLGDNNYPLGAADHIDEAIGQFFHGYIYPYHGSYGEGAEVNRFFPCLGNHDTYTDGGQPYLDYFSLPGNERYYDFTWGAVHLFALNNLGTEPDGVGESSLQAQWLKDGLAASTSPWNIVYMHYPPYSSGMHGSTDWARWPYAAWGADAVLAGHDHTYERLEEDGIPYFVNGVGGAGRYYFVNILDGSLVRYNADYGAMRVEATETQILFEFINRAGELVDSYEINK
jgi:tartrate-resistant acid phosphatase type 5